MKKPVYILTALIVLCSCSKEALEDDIPETNGTLAQFTSTGFGGSLNLSDGTTIAIGYEYPANSVYCNNNGGFPIGLTPFRDLLGPTGDPLTTLYTCSINRGLFTYDYDEVLIHMTKNSFVYTGDLNYNSGDYTHIFFGGRPDYVKYLGEYKGSGGKFETDMLNYTPITGIRLVKGTSDDAPETIKDPKTGITWKWCPGQSGHHDDMNNDHGGDWLYVYYTTEYTGQRLMLTLPYDVADYSEYQNYGGTKYITHLLSAPCEWLIRETPSGSCSDVKTSVEEIKSCMKKALYNAYASDTETYSNYNDLIHAVHQNFDFVRYYDLDMNELNPGYPADFNAGTGCNTIYVSYTYITEYNTEAWARFW